MSTFSINKFSEQPDKTDETDETHRVPNQTFLETVFCDVYEVAQPVLVSFVGNPNKQDKRAWKGVDWSSAVATHYLHDENNNYFSLATFQPDPNGFYHRQKKYFNALHAIMLDDVGTKVPLDGLKIEPSALIETSSGNYQAIYILSAPEDDLEKADQLMKAIISAGLCDPGAGGPAARLARLPCAVNGKHSPAFPCNLKHWNPECCYTVDELIQGLQLQEFMQQPKTKAVKKQNQSDFEGQVHFPIEDQDPVLEALKDNGFFKTPLGDGRYDITCPWVHEHTNAEDGGTAYFEPDDKYPRGGFHCFHGYCNERNIKDLLDFLSISPKAIRRKSTINADPGELDKVVDAAERELAQSGRYYQRGNTISVITTNPENSETTITAIRPPTIRVALANVAHWEKYQASAGGYVFIDPPAAYASALYDMPSYQYLPVLKGLTRQPYLRPDGSLMLTPGYDPESCMFGVFSTRDFNVPEAPTMEDARKALGRISELLEEFCFKEEADKSAALCAILTAAVRASLPKAPMFHTRAPQIGSGKSYLNDIISAFSTPHSVSSTTFPENEEECKKLLLASLLTSPAVINFDNLTCDLLPYPSLCAVITEEYFFARVLGVSKNASVSTRTLFLSSGNNVGPVQDMGRRTITINLDAECEVPAAKEYNNPDPLAMLLKERGKYVSAALTIIRAWIAAGRPQQPLKKLASFGTWVDLCCQPLAWLGLPDPMQSAFAAMHDDPERDLLKRLMDCWFDCFGKRPVMVRDLVNYQNLELREILEDIAPDRTAGINKKVLGHWLKRNKHRIVDGFRIVEDSASRSAKAWKVEQV